MVANHHPKTQQAKGVPHLILLYCHSSLMSNPAFSFVPLLSAVDFFKYIAATTPNNNPGTPAI